MESNRRILIVDDNEDFCLSMQMLLELHGYEASYKLRGRDVLEDDDTLREADLLICDYYIPDVNGVQVVKAAKQRYPGLPAMLLTGSRESHIRNACAQIPGPCKVVYKPVSIELLLDDIAASLSRQ
jgi:two-component system phosphoglycerate transport system response regulator PgtA